MEIDSLPTEIDEINRKIMQLEIEKQVVSKEKDASSKERLEKIKVLNSDMRPVAYLYNLMLWAEIQGDRLLNVLLDAGGRNIFAAIFAAFLAAAAMLWGKRPAIYCSVFTTGYSSMAFSLIILLAYQAAYGYMYEMIGLLTAVFMLGAAIGSHMRKARGNPLKLMRSVEGAAMLLLIVSLLIMKQESAFYLLNFFSGLFTGMQFAAANLSLAQSGNCEKAGLGSAVAGGLYAAELAGSFAGTLLTSIILVPLLGIQNMILSLLSLRIVSLALLLSIRHEKN
ncbi:MAG: hypothetical protein HZA17_05355 [Nitrospirae bacterium]|nr:hypothetical protein [Nitrospirota bacterium]